MAHLKANEPYTLTVAEALSLLSTFTEKRKKRKKRIHTFDGMMGCNVDFKDIKERLKKSFDNGEINKDDYIRLAGPNMKAIGHCVGFYDPKYNGWLFLETDPVKAKKIYTIRKLKF